MSTAAGTSDGQLGCSTFGRAGGGGQGGAHSASIGACRVVHIWERLLAICSGCLAAAWMVDAEVKPACPFSAIVEGHMRVVAL